MALVGTPSISALTTKEMTENQLKDFRKAFVSARADELSWEGTSLSEAFMQASKELKEEESKRVPFGHRDEVVLANRALRNAEARAASTEIRAKVRKQKEEWTMRYAS
tara:strand:- start:68 stop:391 length:324 start_codon:yes stop_codon:yes gene_type:complete